MPVAVSSMAHLFSVVNKSANSLLWKLDHVAIAIASTTSFVPFCYYCFSCLPGITGLYIAVTCILGGGVAASLCFSVFHRSAFRPVRAGLHLTITLWGLVPLVHATRVLMGNPHAMAAVELIYAAVGIMLFGALVFALRVTDRLLPGRVNIIGSSHNIMHCAVVLSNLVFLAGIRGLWLFRSSAAGECHAVI